MSYVFYSKGFTNTNYVRKKRKQKVKILLIMWVLFILIHNKWYGLYLENDGGSWFLLQDTGGAERFKIRVRVVEEVGIIVDQQRLHVVEDESKLVRMLHRVQTWMVLRHQGGSKAAHAGSVQYFTHLEREWTNTSEKKRSHRDNLLSVLQQRGRTEAVYTSCYGSLSTLKWNKKCDSVIQDQPRQLSTAKGCKIKQS